MTIMGNERRLFLENEGETEQLAGSWPAGLPIRAGG